MFACWQRQYKEIEVHSKWFRDWKSVEKNDRTKHTAEEQELEIICECGTEQQLKRWLWSFNKGKEPQKLRVECICLVENRRAHFFVYCRQRKFRKNRFNAIHVAPSYIANLNCNGIVYRIRIHRSLCLPASRCVCLCVFVRKNRRERERRNMIDI